MVLELLVVFVVVVHDSWDCASGSGHRLLLLLLRVLVVVWAVEDEERMDSAAVAVAAACWKVHFQEAPEEAAVEDKSCSDYWCGCTTTWCCFVCQYITDYLGQWAGFMSDEETTKDSHFCRRRRRRIFRVGVWGGGTFGRGQNKLGV